ncbi:MAG TPA: ATP-binding cassette domain-containing protein [Acidimicrobiales bacterium]|nr:ATP-binding cassette domain-containing protein [Acidimicrobiales bacterium]
MDHLGAALLGLGNGGVFAALALALVMTYRSSGVINFATGAMALHGAYMYASLRDGELLVLVPGFPTTVDLGGPVAFAPAVALALLANALLGALVHVAVFRPLRDAPPLAKAVASLGVLVVLQELMAIRAGTDAVRVNPIFPVERWEWGSLTVLSDRFYLVVSVVVLSLVIAGAYRFTRFGLHTRAAAETQVGAYVTGISPNRVAWANWVLSSVVAGVAGILIATISPLTPIAYTLFVVPALAAAVVGGFSSVLLTVVAGVVIGMLQAEALTLAARNDWLPSSGTAELVPLIVIVVALLVTGRAIPVRGGLVRQPLGRAPRPRSLAVPATVGSLVGVGALLVTDGTWRAAVIGTFIAAIIGLSQVVVTGYAGQISVAQLSLAGAGAFTLTGLTQSWGVPFPLAPLLAAAVTAVVGVVIGLPALRLRGLTLGVVTLAFAYTIEAVWFRNTDIVGTTGAKVTRPELFGLDLGIGTGAAFPRIEFGLVCLVTLVLVAVGVAALRRSALGSAMLAVRANERSAAALGVSVVRVKVASFALASFIAGLGGSLLAYRRGVVTFDSFTALGNLALLSTGYLAGITSVLGGLLAGVMASSGIAFTAMDRWVHIGEWFVAISGVLVIVTLIFNPEGLASAGHALADRLPLAGRARRRAGPAPSDRRPPAAAPVGLGPVSANGQDRRRASRAPALEVSELTVRYGGVVAAHRVDLRVLPGTIVGLIGPNGAGKTSVIDAITGFVPASGAVALGGHDLSRTPTHLRVRRGLGRTFQSLELYDDLSVEENVRVALYGARSEGPDGDVARSLALTGIEGLRDRPAGALSQGERQLVSIARACAARPDVVLLDEPAAGLDTSESRWLGERIRAISGAGAGVLLVDHDVALVLGICDLIYVLDLGRVIAVGDPDEIRADRSVAAAYLGSAHEIPVAT